MLKAERLELQTELANAAQPAKVIALYPGTIDRYLKTVAALVEILGRAPADANYQTVVSEFRALVDSVVVLPRPAGQGIEVEVNGKLAALIGGTAFPQARIVGGIDGSGGGT